ncbi:MAG: hypothetical protein QXG65_00655 [Thermoplasmata archaeon]
MAGKRIVTWRRVLLASVAAILCASVPIPAAGVASPGLGAAGSLRSSGTADVAGETAPAGPVPESYGPVGYNLTFLDPLESQGTPGPGAPVDGLGAMAVDPITDTLFVATSDGVAAVSLPSGALEASAALPGASTAPSVSLSPSRPVTGLAFVSSQDELWAAGADGSLWILDPTTLAVEGEIPLASGLGGMVWSPVTDRLYVAVGSLGEVAAVDVFHRSVVGAFPTQVGTEYMAYDPADDRLFIVEGDPFAAHGDSVEIVDLSNGSIAGFTPVGIFPGWITYVDGFVAVVNENAFTANPANVSILEASTGRLLGNVTIGNSPVGIEADVSAGTVWVPLAGNASSPAPRIVAIDPTTLSLVGQALLLPSPVGIAYDPSGPSVIVSSSSIATLSVIPAAQAIPGPVRTVPIASEPITPACDASLGRCYVTDLSRAAIDVVSAVDGSLLGTVPAQLEPWGIALDPALGIGLASDAGAGNLTVFSLANDSVIATVPVGPSPRGIAVDPASHRAFVALQGADMLAVLNLTTLALVRSIPVGASPFAVAYLAGAGEIAVTDLDSDNVTLVSARTLAPVASVPVGSRPSGLAYDPEDGRLYVANSGLFAPSPSDNVTVVSVPNGTLVGSLAVPYDPAGVAWDPAGNLLLVTSLENASLSVLTLPGGGVATSVRVGLAAVYVAVDNVTGGAIVCDALGNTVAFLTPSEYAVRFVPVAPAALVGANWTVTLGGVSQAGTSAVEFSVPNGTYAYSIGTPAGVVAKPENGTLVVDGRSVAELVQLVGPRNATTAPSTGLPSPGEWLAGAVGAIAGAGAVGLARFLRRPRPRGPSPPIPEAPPPSPPGH